MNTIEQYLITQKNSQLVKSPGGRLMPKLPNMPFSPAGGAGTVLPPGENIGLTRDEVQKFNREYAWKQQSFFTNVAANVAAHPVDIDFTGNAWCMIGISVHAIDNFDDDAAAPISLTALVNQERVLDQASWFSLDRKYITGKQFRPFERFLNGRDVFQITIDNTGRLAQDVSIDIYYK